MKSHIILNNKTKKTYFACTRREKSLGFEHQILQSTRCMLDNLTFLIPCTDGFTPHAMLLHV